MNVQKRERRAKRKQTMVVFSFHRSVFVRVEKFPWCRVPVLCSLRNYGGNRALALRTGLSLPLAMLLILILRWNVGTLHAANTEGAGNSKPPSLAVLPFVAASRDAKSLATRMRFAVGQKMSRNGHYHRVDDHDVDAMINALQMPWTPPVTTRDIQTVIESLATDQTVAGFVKGRRLTLELFVGTKLTKTVSATIPPNNTSPRLTIEHMLTALAHLTFHHVRSWQIDPNPALKRLFNARPNLVKDPDFTQAAQFGTHADAWDVFLLKQDYHPPLISAAGAKTLPVNRAAIVPQRVVVPGAQGYCLMLRTDLNIAQSNGLACESDWIPVIQGHRYRLEVWYHSDAPRIRIFINGFAYSPDQFSNPKNPASERRELYRCQVLPVTKNKLWSRTGIDFTPESLKSMRKKYPIRWVRIDFFSYLNAGDAFFRNVELKDITTTGNQ